MKMFFFMVLVLIGTVLIVLIDNNPALTLLMHVMTPQTLLKERV